MSSSILLVEDNPSDEKLTRIAFKRAGVVNELTVVRDGQEALDHLLGPGGDASGAPPLPTVVLLDLNLPRVSGLDVLRRMRQSERARLQPVVVMTSSREDEDVQRSYSLGANAYVRKPLEMDAFVEAARTLGMFWLLLNENPNRSGPGK